MVVSCKSQELNLNYRDCKREPYYSESDLSLVAYMCLSCCISDFLVLLYKWSLSSNSWVIENITCSLDAWLTVLVCRPNHCCLGFTVEFTAVHSMVWLVGIVGNIKRIWMRWRSTQPTTLTLRCLCKHDWSGTKLTETLYEDNISLSNLMKTAVETTSEGFDAANFDHRRNAFKASSDPWTPEF